LIPTASKQKFLELYSTTVGNRKKKRKRSSGGDDSQQQPVAAAASGTDEKVDDDEEERKQPSDDASWIMPTDTKIALEVMCAQFPKIEKASVRPFVLRTQLYSSVRDRTLVDRELEVLRQQQVEPSSSADSLAGCLSAFFVTVPCAVCLIRVFVSVRVCVLTHNTCYCISESMIRMLKRSIQIMSLLPQQITGCLSAFIVMIPCVFCLIRVSLQSGFVSKHIIHAIASLKAW
jgi:hypothetical protein